jgi:lysophospholipase L1-like esterase
MTPLYIADESTREFESARLDVDVVCAGDSLTGWNNYGSAQYWPFPTYPRFLQQKCESQDLQVADGGIAGEISDNGPGHVRRYLELFPNSRYFIIGFGTNDLGTWPDLEQTSQRIIDNLERMVSAVRSVNKRPILFNVPNVNEGVFPVSIVAQCRHKRDFHNARLAAFCEQNEIPLADIRPHLHNEHFGDSLHPNEVGARRIADAVFDVLAVVHNGSI